MTSSPETSDTTATPGCRCRCTPPPFTPAPPGWVAWFAEDDPDHPERSPEACWEPIVGWIAGQRGDPAPLVVDRIEGAGLVDAHDESTFVTVTGPGQWLTRALLRSSVYAWQGRRDVEVDPTGALLRADNQRGPDAIRPVA